ncbi:MULTISPECIES: asparaginase [unclassified Haematospirillum]|uniref:asparaginase n=1 Tax=unclassified Haematospirillum TaxID=2622088 RepID=UPI00143BB4C9|nr:MULTISPECIES: asparaginase domain-containing protein [unclassified Haematospirillum]NKD54422.1 hypothetical protein [Haematospirillum sp. H4890]NKD74465.1 hypothetical protein [Haematospirillum sp. H4485]NKD86864.1 hypothetical protein [Haematospirillum sp. 15-248]
MRPVTIVYTGGTIGMELGERGWRPAASFVSLLDRMLPGCMDGRDVVLEYAPAVDSAHVDPALWYKIGRECVRATSSGHGVIVVHGTDTLSWTAASLALQQVACGAPVVLTGSIIPLVVHGSDGIGNLEQALSVARDPDVHGVLVCFGGRIIPAVRSRKISTSTPDAFRDVLSLAHADASWLIPSNDGIRLGSPPLSPTVIDIGFVTCHPGLSAGFLAGLTAWNPSGLVLECFGSGTAPFVEGALQRVLSDLVHHGTLIVAVSQCADGAIDLDHYEAGAVLRDAGVLAGRGLTRETAFAKLHLILSHSLRGQKAADMFLRDFCGETRIC